MQFMDQVSLVFALVYNSSFWIHCPKPGLFARVCEMWFVRESVPPWWNDKIERRKADGRSSRRVNTMHEPIKLNLFQFYFLGFSTRNLRNLTQEAFWNNSSSDFHVELVLAIYQSDISLARSAFKGSQRPLEFKLNKVQHLHRRWLLVWSWYAILHCPCYWESFTQQIGMEKLERQLVSLPMRHIVD